jgi:hypothetical protein
MRHTRIKLGTALCVVGMVLFSSCSSNDVAPSADSSEFPAGPTLPPVESSAVTTTVVAWDPSKDGAGSYETLLAVTPADEIAAAMPVKEWVEGGFRKDPYEKIFANIERSAELVAAAKSGNYDFKRQPGAPVPTSQEVSIESVERLNDVSCADVSAPPECVGVRFYIVVNGNAASGRLLAHTYKKGDTWVWTAFSFCKVLYNLGQECPIDVPKAPYELKNPTGSGPVSSTTVANG